MRTTRSIMLFGALFVAASMWATPVLAQDVQVIELDSGEIEVTVSEACATSSDGSCQVTCSSFPSFFDKPARPFLGVHLRPIDHTMRVALDFEEPGIMVEKVLPGEAAAKAGVEVGDILLSMNGKAIHDVGRLQALLSEQATGDAVQMKLLRRGKKKTLDLTLGEEPSPHHSFNGFPSREIQCGIEGIDLEALDAIDGDIRAIKVFVSELDDEEGDGDVRKEVRIFMTDDEE